MNAKHLNIPAFIAVATVTVTLTIPASAGNIGFVRSSGAEPPFGGVVFDTEWVTRLREKHTVTIIAQNTPAGDPSLADYDIIIVSQDVGSGAFLGGVGIQQPKPMLLYEPAVYDEIFGVNSNNVAVSSITILNPLIPDPHPLAAGFSGEVLMYTSNTNIPTFTASGVSQGSQVIAVNTAGTGTGTFVVLERGAIGGGVLGNAPALRIGLPCFDTTVVNLVTNDAWKLLDNAVEYALPDPVLFDRFAVSVSPASPKTVATVFNVTITAQNSNGSTSNDSTSTVDQYWNPVDPTANTIAITSNDPTAVLPSPARHSTNGPLFGVTLNSLGIASITLTATDRTNVNIAPDTTSFITSLGVPITWAGDGNANVWDNTPANTVWLSGATAVA